MLTEAGRLTALNSYGVLDTPPEPAFDRIVFGIADALKVPSAMVSFIDADRQWYKARIGVEASFVPRVISFCTHSLGSDAVTVVPDARLDARFCDNPYVTGSPYVRFYAGAPIRASRARVGTVCVYGPAPRQGLTDRQRRHLTDAAAAVAALLDQRRAAYLS